MPSNKGNESYIYQTIAQVNQKRGLSKEQKFNLDVEGEEEVARIILMIKKACALGKEIKEVFIVI